MEIPHLHESPRPSCGLKSLSFFKFVTKNLSPNLPFQFVSQNYMFIITTNKAKLGVGFLFCPTEANNTHR